MIAVYLLLKAVLYGAAIRYSLLGQAVALPVGKLISLSLGRLLLGWLLGLVLLWPLIAIVDTTLQFLGPPSAEQLLFPLVILVIHVMTWFAFGLITAKCLAIRLASIRWRLLIAGILASLSSDAMAWLLRLDQLKLFC